MDLIISPIEAVRAGVRYARVQNALAGKDQEVRIHCYHHAPLAECETQLFRIRQTSSTCFLHSQDIDTATPQTFRDSAGDMFV